MHRSWWYEGKLPRNKQLQTWQLVSTRTAQQFNLTQLNEVVVCLKGLFHQSPLIHAA